MADDKQKKKPLIMGGGYNPNRIIDLTDGQGEATRITHYPHNNTYVIDKREKRKSDNQSG